MLNLNELADGFPAITPAFGQHLAEAGAVCLESQGHQQGKNIRIHGDREYEYSLQWPVVTDQILRCNNDSEVATEHGAIGVAILIVKRIIGYTVVQRSRKGTGFDYWLGEDSIVPFQNKARLEVSGIRRGEERDITKRISQKLHQTNPSDTSGIPAFIVVVEFSRPLADMRRK